MKLPNFRPSTTERGDSLWAQNRANGLRGVDRLDPVWVGLTAAIVIVLIFLFSVGGIFRSDSINNEIVRDNRILKSYDNMSDCFGSVASDIDDMVLVALKNDPNCRLESRQGAVGHYDPVWRVWKSETAPFAQDTGVTQPTTLARISDLVWIQGNEGGLAAYDGSEWAVWLAQSHLIIEGRRLSESDVVAVASSEDRAWTIVSTVSGQAGLYNALNGQWRALPNLPGNGRVSELIWVEDAIWMVRGDGLWRISIATRIAKFSMTSKLADGQFDELAIQPNKSVLILETRKCADISNIKKKCIRITRYSPVGTLQEVLLDSTNSPISWTAKHIHFVHAFADILVLAGPGGVRRYSISKRMWTILERRPITHFKVSFKGDMGYGGVGFAAHAGRRAKSVNVTSLPGSKTAVTDLFFDGKGSLLITVGSGGLFRLKTTGALQTVFTRTAPMIASAVTFGRSSRTHDFFTTSKGQVSMDRRNRLYKSVGRNKTLQKLNQATRISSTGNSVFAFVPAGVMGELIYFDPSSPSEAIKIQIQQVSSITKTGERSALVTTKSGRLWSVIVSGKDLNLTELTNNQPSSGPSSSEVVDASVEGAVLALASSKGISLYDSASRRWETATTTSVRSVTFSESRDQMLTTFDDGTLARITKHDNKWRESILIGNSKLPHQDGNELDDTWQTSDGQLAFLGGQRSEAKKTLTLYDPRMRSVKKLGEFPSTGKGEILSFQSGRVWMVRIGNRAWTQAGPVPLAKGSSRIISGWQESRMITVTLERDKNNGLLFLHRQNTKTGEKTCLFRGVSFKPAKLQDSFRISKRRSVLSTTKGIHIYDERLNRWADVDIATGAYTIAMRGGDLWMQIVGGANKKSLYRVNLKSVPVADACAPQNAKAGARDLGHAVATSDGAIMYQLKANGAIARAGRDTSFRNVFTRPKMPSVTGPPLRVLEVEGALLIVFADAVLRYDPDHRTWQELARFAPKKWKQVTLSKGAGRLAGSVIAMLINVDSWLEVRIPRSARNISDVSKREERLPNVKPLAEARSLGPIEAFWVELDRFVVQFERGIASFSLNGGNWLRAWPLTSRSDKVGRVGGRLLSWSPANRNLRFEKNKGTFTSDAEISVPVSVELFVDQNGLPAWVGRDGAMTRCNTDASCIQSTVPRVPFDMRRIKRVLQLGQAFILVDPDGFAGIFDPRTKQFRRLRAAQSIVGALSMSEAMQTPLGPLRLSRDGKSVFMRGESGDTVQIAGRRSFALRKFIKNSATQGAQLVNLDDLVSLGNNKVIGITEQTALPEWMRSYKFNAIGKIGETLWLQSGAALISFPQTCGINAQLTESKSRERPGNASEIESEGALKNKLEKATTDKPEDISESSSAEAVNCTVRTVALPSEFAIAFVSLFEQESIAITLQDGSQWVQKNSAAEWTQKVPPYSLPEQDMVDFLKNHTFQLGSNLASFTQGAVIDNSASDGTATILIPSIRQNSRKEKFTPISKLRHPSAALPWLRFDASKNKIQFHGSTNAQLSARNAFDTQGNFIPFKFSVPAPQSDGSVLVAILGGTVRLEGASLSNVQKARYQFTGITDPANLIPDSGGYWNGTRFLAWAPGKAVPSINEQMKIGSVNYRYDRRVPGVSMKKNGKSVIGPDGFLWDSVNNIGLTERDQVVTLTPLGPLALNAPMGDKVAVRVIWTQDIMQALAFSTDKSDNLNNMGWQTNPDASYGVLERDKLEAAIYHNSRIILSTGTGLGKTQAFVRPKVTVAQAIRVNRLGINRGMRQITTQVGDKKLIVDPKTLQTRLPDQKELLQLTSQIRWKKGPLKAVSNITGGYNLILSSKDRETPALSFNGFFRMDIIHSVKRDQKGGLILATDGGVFMSRSSEMDIGTWSAITLAHNQKSYRLTEFEGDILIFEDDGKKLRGCLRHIPGTDKLIKCQSKNQNTYISLAAQTKGGGRLQAQLLGNNWLYKFRLGDQSKLRPTNLNSGRFSHDRIVNVSVCANQLHILDGERHHSIRNINGSWKTGAYHKSYPNAAGIYCGDPKRFVGLSAGPWMETLNGKWLLLNKEGEFKSVVPGRSAWASMSFGKMGLGVTPVNPRLKRQGLLSALLLSKTGNTLEWLNIGLNVSKDNFSVKKVLRATSGSTIGPLIDRPDRFFSVSNQLWGVTRDGLLPYGPVVARTAKLTPGQGPRLALDASCSVKTSLRISSTVTQLLCTNGDRYNVLIKQAGEATLTKAQILPSVKTFEAGQLSLTVTDLQGLTTVRLFGEILGRTAFQGGFSFDEIRNLQIAPSGKIHTVSKEGWYVYFNNTMSLSKKEERAGQQNAALRSRAATLKNANSIEQSFASDLLCVSSGKGVAFALAENAKTLELRNQGWHRCPKMLGRDEKRSHWSFDQIPWLSYLTLSPTEIVRDEFKSGRFASDTATGLPLMQRKITKMTQSPTFCARSKLKDILIWGDASSAIGHTRAANCEAQWIQQLPIADSSTFSLRDGHLIRNQ